MNKQQALLVANVSRLIAVTEHLLSDPFLRQRITVVAVARDWLIRQLFVLEQLSAAVRLGEPTTELSLRLVAVNQSTQKAINAVRDYYNGPKSNT
jgi:hypothetical protein